MPDRTGPVLVTGASGLIGREVVRSLLAAGRDVHAVARRPPAAPDRGVAWHSADLLDLDDRRRLARLIQPSAVIHCAWCTAHGAYWTAPENGAWVEATLHLADTLVDAGAGRFVGVGTCAEYDWLDGGEYAWPETRPCRPASPYGRAKYAAYQGLTRSLRARGVSFAWARIFHTFGPGEPEGKLVASLCRALAENRIATCLTGGLSRDYLDVADVGRAIAAILASELTGAVNVGRGEAVSLGAIADMLGRLAGRPDLVRVGAGGQEPISMTADVTRLAGATGFRATSLEEGLGRCLTHWVGVTRSTEHPV